MKTLINSFVSELTDSFSYRYILEEIYQDYAVLRVVKWESGESTNQFRIVHLQDFTNPYVWQFFTEFSEMQEYHNKLMESNQTNNDEELTNMTQSDRVLH